MDKRGFTLAELMVGVTIMGVLASIAFPRVMETRERVAARSATEEFVSTHSWSRTLAMRFGRVAYLLIDDAAGRYWVMIDTTLARTGLDTMGVVHDVADENVSMDSSTGLLCFDARGIAAARSPCPSTQSVIRFVGGGTTSEITVTPLGKVLR